VSPKQRRVFPTQLYLGVSTKKMKDLVIAVPVHFGRDWRTTSWCVHKQLKHFQRNIDTADATLFSVIYRITGSPTKKDIKNLQQAQERYH
jgi:hypothetical protein